MKPSFFAIVISIAALTSAYTSKLSTPSSTSTDVPKWYVTCPAVCGCSTTNETHPVSIGHIVNCTGKMILEVPNNIPKLTTHLTIANTNVEHIGSDALKNLTQTLSQLELRNNPIRSIGKGAFTNLPNLKELVISSARKLKTFPDLSGTNGLEHLRIDRGEIALIPPMICEWAPKLKSLIVKSNRITALPILDGCTELRLIDFSYNEISSLGDEPLFSHQAKLIDLFLGHNAIREIPENAFHGLETLQVLELENNGIKYIHPEAFEPLKELRDLNLGKNKFSALPTKGLQNLRRIKTFNNPALKEFPDPETFPKIHTLALSYAYHCCSFLPLKTPPTYKPPSLQDTILWLQKEDVDMSLWSSNNTDLWPSAGGGGNGVGGADGNSTKLAEFVNTLWKTYGKDYQIPDNLAQYAEEYFEDYKSAYGGADDSLVVRYPVQCLPQPGGGSKCYACEFDSKHCPPLSDCPRNKDRCTVDNFDPWTVQPVECPGSCETFLVTDPTGNIVKWRRGCAHIPIPLGSTRANICVTEYSFGIRIDKCSCNGYLCNSAPSSLKPSRSIFLLSVTLLCLALLSHRSLIVCLIFSLLLLPNETLALKCYVCAWTAAQCLDFNCYNNPDVCSNDKFSPTVVQPAACLAGCETFAITDPNGLVQQWRRSCDVSGATQNQEYSGGYRCKTEYQFGIRLDRCTCNADLCNGGITFSPNLPLTLISLIAFPVITYFSL